MNVLDLFSLKDKVALVTGGAGLCGRQIVAALAEAGARTYVGSRHIDPLEELAQEHAALGHDVIAVELDQADERSALAARDRILEESGRIDILVNNAVLRPMKDGYFDKPEAFAASMEVNATGLFIITRAIGDVMESQRSGSIINIGSIQGMVGPDPSVYEGTEIHGWYPDYFFHKGGMINYTRFVGSYYGHAGVRCNCIGPGGFESERTPEAFVRNYSARTFLGRMAGETDVKGVVVFLASDASAYITGATIPVDGGYTAK
jgi:NAD(P)-dependent dehydrogenase (short-subunit alcohol dehydrogenase family)